MALTWQSKGQVLSIIIDNKNVTNLRTWQWKTIVLHALHMHSIFGHFIDVLILSATWNDLFCSCVDDVSIWWQMFHFVFLSLKRWFQFNSIIVRTHFSSIMTFNNWKMIAETRSYIFRRRSRFRRRRLCLSSLMLSVCRTFLRSSTSSRRSKNLKMSLTGVWTLLFWVLKQRLFFLNYQHIVEALTRKHL